MLIDRHALRRMRLFGISVADVARTIADPDHLDHDEAGHPRYWRRHDRHPCIRVVMSAEDPDVLITVHPRRRLARRN